MNEWVDWMDGGMNGWMAGWMNEWMKMLGEFWSTNLWYVPAHSIMMATDVLIKDCTWWIIFTFSLFRGDRLITVGCWCVWFFVWFRLSEQQPPHSKTKIKGLRSADECAVGAAAADPGRWLSLSSAFAVANTLCSQMMWPHFLPTSQQTFSLQTDRILNFVHRKEFQKHKNINAKPRKNCSLSAFGQDGAPASTQLCPLGRDVRNLSVYLSEHTHL